MSELVSRLQSAPEPTAFEYALAMAKVGTIAFPFLGAGVALFDVVTAPARAKRLSEWCEELRLRLNDLSQKMEGMTPEALATNDSFISVLAQATQAALKTHQSEKLAALRNAVLNVAISKGPSEDLQLIFLNLVDTFTPTHLQILACFAGKDRAGVATFRNQRELADQVVQDLNDRGLLRDTRPYAARNRDSPDGLIYLEWEITNLGRQFLEFIKSP